MVELLYPKKLNLLILLFLALVGIFVGSHTYSIFDISPLNHLFSMMLVYFAYSLFFDSRNDPNKSYAVYIGRGLIRSLFWSLLFWIVAMIIIYIFS